MSEIVAATHPLLAGLEPSMARTAGEPGWLRTERLRGAARFEEVGVPSRSLEEWRSTNLKHLTTAPPPLAAEGTTGPGAALWSLDNAHSLVFVDGRLRPELSELGDLPQGVTVRGLSELTEEPFATLEDRLGSAVMLEDHPMAALNTALFPDAALVHLEPGTALERPIHLVFVAGERDRPVTRLPRVLLDIDANSHATVVESFVGADGPADVTNAVTEVLLGEGATLDHYSLIEEGAEATHLSGFHARQARDSALRSHGFTLGGALVRRDITTALTGEGADATLNGLYLTRGRQHVDHQLRVHHTRPHCTSHQLYKGVLDDSSRTIFNGRIVVDPGAQKTDAKQANRNLLLSQTAQAQSNPQLEIYADDVRCTHGSTVGRLDDEAVFYLRTRGIDRTAAEHLLTFAFAAEIVEGVRIGSLRDRLREMLFDRLPGSRLIRETS